MRLTGFKKTIILFLSIAIAVFAIANIPVITRQGVSGLVTEKKIPLYIKACSFLDRDYQYRNLSRRITKGTRSGKEKLAAIYAWTITNIKELPSGFDVIDDHIWSTVVRRYGTPDQKAEVFTALCSYAGYESFKARLSIEGITERLILSFVKVGEDWHIFDLRHNKYMAKESDLEKVTPYGPTYNDYLEMMDKNLYKRRFRRADKQKILSRIAYEVRKIFKGNQGAYLTEE